MPRASIGNLLLDKLLGARIRWRRPRPRAQLEEVADVRSAAGRKPYVIPLAARSGASAYAVTMEELCARAWNKAAHRSIVWLNWEAAGGPGKGTALNYSDACWAQVDKPADRARQGVQPAQLTWPVGPAHPHTA